MSWVDDLLLGHQVSKISLLKEGSRAQALYFLAEYVALHHAHRVVLGRATRLVAVSIGSLIDRPSPGDHCACVVYLT